MTRCASAFSTDLLVNGAADFPSVVETPMPLGEHDGWKIRRSIHQFVS